MAFNSAVGAQEDGAQLGTYQDPLSGVKETAVTGPQADAYLRLGWVKTTEDEKVVNGREQILQALELDSNTVGFRNEEDDLATGNTSAESVDAARAAAVKAAESDSKKGK